MDMPYRFDAVYPRPRGGTATGRQSCRLNPGLSPPTRGNLAMNLKYLTEMGSIPAHAGEPR